MALLLGVILLMLLTMQIDLPIEYQLRICGGLFWITIVFAGTLAIERAFASEQDGGCWDALKLYPVPPAIIFFAKMAVTFMSLCMLEAVLIPLFVVLMDVPMFGSLGSMLLIVLLSNVGFAAAGSVLGALSAGLGNRSGLLPLLLLPVVAPLFLGSAAATRIVVSGEQDSLWSWWLQLLAVFAATFTIVGAIVFEFILEE
jgi:heme exporter protein B